MRFNLNVLFPRGTLRRLMAKTLMLLIRHPLAAISQLRFSHLPIWLKQFWQREFALLEDRFAGLPASPDAHPAVAETGYPNIVPGLPAGPLVRLGVYVTRKTMPDLTETLSSLAQQTYPNWEPVLVHAPDVKPDALAVLAQSLSNRTGAEIIPVSELARLWHNGDYIGLLQAGDELASPALAKLVLPTMGAQPDLVYCDEAPVSPRAGAMPFYKPDWSPRLLLGMNYVGDFFLCKRERLARVGPGPDSCSPEGRYDLLLKCTDQPLVVKHLPEVLYHSARRAVARPDRGRASITSALTRRKIEGEVISLRRPGTYRVRRRLSRQPLVSIIVPTALRRCGMLRRCLTTLQRRTSYRHLQMILVDNSTGGTAKQEIPQGLAVTHLPYPEPFNYSRMNNLAAQQAEGEYLVFLNDDTEILTPDWLESLLEQAQVPQTGVVGCQLEYPNGLIQHAGMFLVRQGAGARHAFRFLRNPENSYHGLGTIVRECSSVTFACAMVPREVYQSLGGLDENLRVECNDLDFCLRAGQKGYGIIYTPFARVRHAELVSRRATHISEDIQTFKQRWQWLLEAGDPYYNPNLSENSDLYLPEPRA